jgi:hypothetical protein
MVCCALNCAAGSAEIKLTSGLQATGALRKATAGARILPLSQCPPSGKCSAASAVSEVISNTAPDAYTTTAAVQASSPAPSIATSPPASTPAPAPAQRHTVIANLTNITRLNSCPPSQLGYQCSHQLAPGIVLHHSRGGRQPENHCTNKTSFNDTLMGPAADRLHFAIQSSQEVMMWLGGSSVMGGHP